MSRSVLQASSAESAAPATDANRVLSGALTAVTHLLGLAAFLYPFLLGSVDQGGETLSHAGDAPLLFSAFGTLLVVLAVSEVRAGRMDAKQVALLGILSGINAVLRLPGALAGASLMFALPILCGYAYGARFGFMLGASSMAVSGLITGGVGPWLPFQMWALGWVGGGAGLLRRVVPGAAPGAAASTAASRAAIVALAAYGWLTGLLYGAVINLWFWPFLAGRSEISWEPGIAAGEGLVRYWRFYLLTSLAWDSARAVVNVVLIASLGRPLLRLLLRFRGRLFVAWRPASEAVPLEAGRTA